MNILKRWVWPVVAGFLVASVIMVIFEYINSFFFPVPENGFSMSIEELHALTASLPWTAYILVFLGWAFGAFEGGCTAAWLAGENQFRATAVLAVLLVIAGIADMVMIGFPPIAMALGLLILAVSPFLGRLALNTFEKKKRESVA
jgi:hypothetical protein